MSQSHLTITLLVLALAPSCTDRVNTNVITRQSNGRCDLADLTGPPPTSSAELTEITVPETLALAAAVVPGVAAPRSPRIGLVAEVVDDHGAHLVEIESQKIDALPTHVELAIPAAPAGLLDGLRAQVPPGADPSVATLHASVVIYDDANHDGALELGTRYLSPPGSGASEAEWERYAAERDAWDLRYGTINFAGWSSPSDPDNELVALSAVRLTYRTDGVHAALVLSDDDCQILATDDHGTCTWCQSRESVMPDHEVTVTVGWALESM
ncbi:MAG: hypothetical protein JWO36_6531 [Myxococcales bacterium]|nr:hypothetical protein [Myxococcales bacterium]